MIFLNVMPDISHYCPVDTDDYEECPDCQGSGEIEDYQTEGMSLVISDTYPCAACDGRGWLQPEEMEADV